MQKDDIIIRNAIIHIVDSKCGYPVLSDELMDLGPDLNDFIRNHIFKVASSDEAKSSSFMEESEIAAIIRSFSEE